MGCGCRGKSNLRSGRSVGISRASRSQATIARVGKPKSSQVSAQNVTAPIEQDKLRVQKLRREAIFKALGHY